MSRVLYPVLLACLIFLASVAGCMGSGNSDFPDAGPPPDANTRCLGTIPTFGEVTLFDVCTQCHSSKLTTDIERQGAPLGVNYDTYQAAVQNALQGDQAVKAGVMPLSGSVTSQQKEDFYTWAECGTPQ